MNTKDYFDKFIHAISGENIRSEIINEINRQAERTESEIKGIENYILKNFANIKNIFNKSYGFKIHLGKLKLVHMIFVATINSIPNNDKDKILKKNSITISKNKIATRLEEFEKDKFKSCKLDEGEAYTSRHLHKKLSEVFNSNEWKKDIESLKIAGLIKMEGGRIKILKQGVEIIAKFYKDLSISSLENFRGNE